MRIRASCGHCGHDLYLFEVACFQGPAGDRCPRCARRLGDHIGPSAERAEHALAALVGALEELRKRSAATLQVDSRSVIEPLKEALGLDEATRSTDGEARGPPKPRGPTSPTTRRAGETTGPEFDPTV